jgi:3-hydroxyacyl-[acyl-carrier-protein] dehydratase
MYFSLIDRIENIELGKQIVATKSLSLAEEYLRDHFPKFPVMPGVLMLEALTQASAWLVRATDQFAHSLVVLKEARSVKYARFVQPGQTLRLAATITNADADLVTLKAEGTLEGQTNLKAQLILRRYNLSEKNPDQNEVDKKIIQIMRQQFNLLYKNITTQ